MYRWRALEAEWGRPIFLRTGQVHLANEWTPALRRTRVVFDRLNVAYEVLTHDEVRSRYPQFDPSGVEFAVFTQHGGVANGAGSEEWGAGLFGCPLVTTGGLVSKPRPRTIAFAHSNAVVQCIGKCIEP